MVVLISYIDGVISYIGGVIFSYVGLNVGRHNSYMSVLTHPAEHTCDMYYVMQFYGCTYLLHRLLRIKSRDNKHHSIRQLKKSGSERDIPSTASAACKEVQEIEIDPKR